MLKIAVDSIECSCSSVIVDLALFMVRKLYLSKYLFTGLGYLKRAGSKSVCRKLFFLQHFRVIFKACVRYFLSNFYFFTK